MYVEADNWTIGDGNLIGLSVMMVTIWLLDFSLKIRDSSDETGPLLSKDNSFFVTECSF